MDNLMGIAQAFFNVLGVVVVIIGVWNIVKSVGKGEIPKAVKTFVGSALVAAVLFNIQLPISVARGLGGIIEGAVEVVQEVVSGEDPAGSSGTGGSPSVPDGPASGSNDCDYPWSASYPCD